MRIMGLDYGSKTVGVAISDEMLLTAQPIETITRARETKLRQTLARIEELMEEYDVEKVVIGLPKKLNNEEGDRCDKTREFAEMVELYPKQLYMPHRGLVIPDERYWKYMEKGLAATKDEIIRILASYPTLEAQILEMEEVFWKKAADGAWPREAFDMNAKAMLRTVAAEFPEELSKAKSIQK